MVVGVEYKMDVHQNAPDSRTILQQSSHPMALVFMLLFRLSALTIYVLGWLFISNFILSFVLIILMLAFDFWTVKNVSGRLLVGLRWWNEIKDDGSNEWVFESKENRTVNATDSRMFWFILYLAPVAWVILAVFAVFRLQASWFLVCMVAVSMSTANLVGYTKCERDYKKKAAQFVTEQGFVSSFITSGLLSRLI